MSQDQLSSAPLLSPLEGSRGSSPVVDMATVGVSPAPEKLDIHKQPEAEPLSSRAGVPRQFSLQGQESTKSTAGAKVNREFVYRDAYVVSSQV